jgi:hypothetical protein
LLSVRKSEAWPLQRLALHASNGLACNSGIYLRPKEGVSLLEVIG